jgi:cob(I)alamin adenosyltransferase
MCLYTGTGDKGRTGLPGGGRVAKDHLLMVVQGDIDELNAAVGLAEAACQEAGLSQQLRSVQADLFVIGAQLAAGEAAAMTHRIEPEAVERIEKWIDAASAEAGPLRHFILPGGVEVAARLHVARAVCRRAERSVVRLARETRMQPLLLVYLNRLSDLLFALARSADRRAGREETIWPAS